MTEPYYRDEKVTLHLGDCRAVLAAMADHSVDAVITDPPYELGFMGKGWDASGIAYDVALWAEVLRVLKPGGHLLAFGGTRTYHRMACAIEDAGFEVRDSIHWIYGTGFPKSLDVSKAIDKVRDDRHDVVRVTSWLKAQADAAGVTRAAVDAHLGTSDMGGWWLTDLLHRCQVPKWDQWLALRDLIGFGEEMDAEVWRLNGRKGTPGEAWDQREVIGTSRGTSKVGGADGATPWSVGATQAGIDLTVTAPATPDAATWQGWGTALKPAHEPIIVARRPVVGTVAGNVLAHGTGAINVDACRVGTEPAFTGRRGGKSVGGLLNDTDGERVTSGGAGRWPANIVLTHAPDCGTVCADGCPVAELDAQSGVIKSGTRKAGTYAGLGYMGSASAEFPAIAGDTGGASRFFPAFRYEAKAPSLERPRGGDTADGQANPAAIGRRRCATCGKQAVNVRESSQCACPESVWVNAASSAATAHPTVKPLDLMRWLVRLVTPPGGTVLDPFAGSGTTAEACVVEGFHCLAVEAHAPYLPLIVARLSKPIALVLDFGDLG